MTVLGQSQREVREKQGKVEELQCNQGGGGEQKVVLV
jgi:hypothetical protein